MILMILMLNLNYNTKFKFMKQRKVDGFLIKLIQGKLNFLKLEN